MAAAACSTHDGTTTLTNCTVSGNSAGDTGGGLYNHDSPYSTLTIGNTIVAGNTATTSGPDAVGTIASQGNNLIGKTDGSSGWVGSDLTGTIAAPLNPLLAPLGNYGGPTQTMALLPGSPAIDAGNNALIPAGVTTDQRGLPRIVNTVVDIGAFESSGFTIAVTSGSGQSTGVLTAFPAPLVVTVTAKNPSEPVAGGLVTFTPPSSGASATISGSPATISAAGTASVTATANGIVGSYTVSATASGITTPASFSLTNDQLIIALDPSALGSTQPLGQREHQHSRCCLCRFQLVECPVGQRQRQGHGRGHRCPRRRQEERQRQPQSDPGHGGRRCSPWPRCRYRAPRG